MWLKKKPSELRVIIVLVLIVAIISFTGISSYLKLSAIANRVSSTINLTNRNSIILKSILVELEDARNNVRSYNLTGDDQYALSFYTSVVTIEKKFNDLNSDVSQLQSIKDEKKVHRAMALTEKCLTLMKRQLYISDDKNITEELDAISFKIDEAYTKTKNEPYSDNTNNQLKPIEKESIFSRIFRNKNKRLRPSVVSSENTDSVRPFSALSRDNPVSIKSDLQNTVRDVKIKQQVKLARQKNSELQLSTEVKQLMFQLRDLTVQTELTEELKERQNIDFAKREVETIKTLAIIISSVITVLLLTVIYLIVKYIGKKKEYEQALIHAKQHAEELAKTKEAFLANMSHEIKTPLNAIYGFTEQVLKGNLETEQYEQLNIVKESADHLIRLISDILDYSKIQSGKIQIENVDFDLKRELENIHTLFVHQSTNKNLELTFSIDNNLPGEINGSLTKLKQVMYNLISNAIKFTEKGKVTVSVSTEQHRERSFLAIRVKDTGIGIAKNKLPKLFNEYEQLHSDAFNKFGGTGLGLVITKKLLEQMGGSIQVTSEENRGTEVSILYPFFKTSHHHHKNKNSVHENEIAEMLHGKRILVVDDEQFNRLLLKAILGKFETEVLEAVNGNEAVNIVRHTSVDLVLMDLRMPEKSGTEACKEIRNFNKDLVILASTALNREQAKATKKSGFNGVVSKPFTEKNLLETIHSFLIKNNNNSVPKNKLNLNELNSLANGDDHFKKDMIKLFDSSIKTALDSITQARVLENWTEIAESAHKVLPSCKHFDASELYSLFKFFENLKNTPFDSGEVDIKLQQLKKEVDAIHLELQVYL